MLLILSKLVASLLYLCTGAGCGTSPTDGVAALLSKLVASLLYLCALVQGAGPAQRMGLRALPSKLVAGLLYLCAGCGTSPTDGVAELLSKLVASLLYLCLLVQGAEPAQRLGLRCSLASLLQAFCTYVHWYRVRNQANGWGCGAP